MPWSTLSWRASFRGVDFRLERGELAARRRLAEHRAPQRTIPYMEDMGREARRWTVEAYVVGDDAPEQRDRLLEACEDRSGPGDLAHPLYGVVLAWCVGVRVREDPNREGRLVRFTLQFVEADERRLVVRSQGGVADADQVAASLRADAEPALAGGLQVDGQPQSVLDAAADVMHETGQAMLGLSVFGGTQAKVAALLAQARALSEQASTLITAPADFAAALADGVEGVFSAVGANAAGIVDAYRVLFGVDSAQPAGVGNVAQAGRANAQLTLGLVRGMSLAGMVRGTMRRPWSWYEQAVEARLELLDLLDELLADGLAESFFQQTAELRRVLHAEVPPPGQDLPRIASVTLGVATPALVLAAELYDDPERADEVAERNRVRHPGWLPGGVPLEVLNA